MTQTDSPIIELRHVNKHFGDLHVLRDISLRVYQGEVVVIVGPSGSGKSTLCRTINRLETIDSGEILIDGGRIVEESDPETFFLHPQSERAQSFLNAVQSH